MGVIKEVIKKADQTPGVTAEVKEALNLLYELSKQKADLYEEKIARDLRNAGTTENPTVPITVKIERRQEIRATTSNTPDKDITEGIKTALKDILAGSKDGIIDGLTSLINTGLKAVLGVGEGEEREEHTYFISTEGLSIVRLDLIYWCRHVTAASITKYAEKSVVCTAVKSSVDVNKIDFNAFLAAYQAQLVRCKFDESQLEDELKNARKIYNLLREEPNVKASIDTNPFNITDFGVLSSKKNKVSGIWPARIE